MNVGDVEPKGKWWLGVTKNFPLHKEASATAENGFWFLSFNSDHFETEPKVSLPVPSRPKTVGVYLDCDSGELSFYNVEERRLISSLSVPVGDQLFPLFNTGTGDTSPMKLIHQTEGPGPDPDSVKEQHNSQ